VNGFFLDAAFWPTALAPNERIRGTRRPVAESKTGLKIESPNTHNKINNLPRFAELTLPKARRRSRRSYAFGSVSVFDRVHASAVSLKGSLKMSLASCS
jgi:hypothetical protein